MLRVIQAGLGRPISYGPSPEYLLRCAQKIRVRFVVGRWLANPIRALGWAKLGTRGQPEFKPGMIAQLKLLDGKVLKETT